MTARRVRWLVVVTALAIVAVRPTMAGQQAAAFGSVSGVVLTTEEPPRPVRRAVVSLRGSDLPLGHHAITDDAGRFEIRDLPAGRYDLSANRPAFVTIAYGASRPEWPGTALAIAAGEHLSRVTIRLAPGAIITGTVRDGTGAPAADLEVCVERRMATGELFQRFANTDPQGVYRFYGLAPGAYTVWVRPLRTSGDVTYARNDAEVDAILLLLQQGRLGAQPATITRPPSARPSVSDFAPIYYPNAFTSEGANPVVLTAGEERTGVDMSIRLMSSSRLVGRVVGADNQPVGSGSVDLLRASRTPAQSRGVSIHADGTFEFPAVSPGRYRLVMWRALSIGASTAPCEFATSDLEITGSDPPEVQLTLKPCLKIAGRVEVAGDATPGSTRPSFAGATVRFDADRSSGAPMDTLLPILAAVDAGGTFTVGGARQLVPGSYLVHADVPTPVPGTGWWLQSARTADGHDILDVPLALTDNSPETTSVVLTFTDRHTSLSGLLTTAGGRPAIDYTVIAFTTNRDWWRPPFRRVLTARPATDGAFLLRDLPPGDYLLAALADVAPNEWLDPAFLERVARQGVPVAIGPGEQKVQSLQIARGTGPAPAIERDLAYGNEALQRLDLSIPATRGFPTVIFVHGGSLVSGDKADTDYGKVCDPFPAAGVACANINYRLLPASAWPAPVEDLASAIAWLHAQIGDRGGDPNKLFLLGHSSGAMLVALVAADARYLSHNNISSTIIRGVMPMGSIMWDDDLRQSIEKNGRTAVEAGFARDPRGKSFGSLDAYQGQWPINYVRAGLPAYLFLIAESEQINPPILKTNQQFVDDARAKGNDAALRVFSGRTHYSNIRKIHEPGDEVFGAVQEFVKRLSK